MNIWMNTSFDGHYPVGVAAVVVADTAELAAYALNAELQQEGLAPTATAEQFTRLDDSWPSVHILNNGNY